VVKLQSLANVENIFNRQIVLLC